MLTYLMDIWENLISIFKTMSVVDYFDIIILALIVYGLLKLVKETRAIQLLKGILFIAVILILIKQFDFRALGLLSESFTSVGFMAVIVMFQPELRRVLEKVGRTNVVKSIAFNLENNPVDTKTQVSGAIEQVSSACEKLSRTATGALIVMERQTKLGEQVDTGTVLNAFPSAELLRNIFFPNSPLHDGAVIIRSGSILAASCFLPKPQNEELVSKDLGSRHRAAIGMSEVSDAIVVIVSEETGIISIAENGVITRGFTREKLSEYLTAKLLPEKAELLAKRESKEKKRLLKIRKTNKNKDEINQDIE